ncbi:MAG: endonuclease/exonuclease/phosphatase family protein, partial [Muribaculum sp.]|nr:endonuclease/exonuclease/phosphatase family protein [Muribaculum sp.]
MRKFAILSIIICGALSLCHARPAADEAQQYYVAGVAFYNVENLFDTINQNGRFDLDYTPEGRRMWDSIRYNNKLDNLAAAITTAMTTPETPDGPSIIGLSEVENESVVRDLAARIDATLLAQGRNPWGLQYIHHDSPDPRGIDVAMLYNPAYFEVSNVNNHEFLLPDEPTFRTRDQMVVSGHLLGFPLSVVVNHWPSRLGGQQESEYRRIAAGQ